MRAEAAAAAAPPASDAFAAAERIQEVAWTMRERGLDPSTCDQIEARYLFDDQGTVVPEQPVHITKGQRPSVV